MGGRSGLHRALGGGSSAEWRSPQGRPKERAVAAMNKSTADGTVCREQQHQLALASHSIAGQKRYTMIGRYMACTAIQAQIPLDIALNWSQKPVEGPDTCSGKPKFPRDGGQSSTVRAVRATPRCCAPHLRMRLVCGASLQRRDPHLPGLVARRRSPAATSCHPPHTSSCLPSPTH